MLKLQHITVYNKRQFHKKWFHKTSHLIWLIDFFSFYPHRKNGWAVMIRGHLIATVYAMLGHLVTFFAVLKCTDKLHRYFLQMIIACCRNITKWKTKIPSITKWWMTEKCSWSYFLLLNILPLMQEADLPQTNYYY